MFKDRLGKSNKRNCLTRGHSFSLVRFCVRLHCAPCLFFLASTANTVTLYILYYHFSFILKAKKTLTQKRNRTNFWKFTDTHTQHKVQAPEQAQLNFALNLLLILFV